MPDALLLLASSLPTVKREPLVPSDQEIPVPANIPLLPRPCGNVRFRGIATVRQMTGMGARSCPSTADPIAVI